MKQAVIEWFNSTRKPLDTVQGEDYRLLRESLKVELEPEDPVPQPEALIILYMLRSQKTTYWQGGLWDQPYLLSLELATCEAAEAEFVAKVRESIQDLREQQSAKK